MKAYRRGGDGALEGHDPSGRPRKLTPAQERQVLGWFRRSTKSFGFPTELWTAARVAQVIYRKWRIKFHPRYLNQWLAERRITPQKPRFQAREQDEAEVQRWLRKDWPRIKKVRRGDGPIWC
jgi:transposase